MWKDLRMSKEKSMASGAVVNLPVLCPQTQATPACLRTDVQRYDDERTNCMNYKWLNCCQVANLISM